MRPKGHFTPLEEETEKGFITLIVAFRQAGDIKHLNEAKRSLHQLYDIVRKRELKNDGR